MALNEQLNGPMMHNGAFNSLEQVIDHYNNLPFDPRVNNNLDPRLRPMNRGQRLQLSDAEKQHLLLFCKP